MERNSPPKPSMAPFLQERHRAVSSVANPSAVLVRTTDGYILDDDRPKPSSVADLQRESQASTSVWGFLENEACNNAAESQEDCLCPELVEVMSAANMELPVSLVEEFLPAALSGADVLLQGPDGQHIMFAYVAVCLEKLRVADTRLQALVVCHTKNIAFQVGDIAQTLCKHIDVQVGTVYGGMPIGKDKEMLLEGNIQMLTGTPGRLLALISSGSLDLSGIHTMVIHDVELLGNKSAKKDVQNIFIEFQAARKGQAKQMMMFGSKLTPDVVKLCEEMAGSRLLQLEICDGSDTEPPAQMGVDFELRTHPCQVCGATFKKKKFLRQHAKGSHPELCEFHVMGITPGAQPTCPRSMARFRCTVCGANFEKWPHCKHHVLMEHPSHFPRSQDLRPKHMRLGS